MTKRKKGALDQVRAETVGKDFVRSFSIDRADDSVDQEARTVAVAFSSEEPVDRWFGKEILDHNPKSVRLDRLQDGGAVLTGHDHRDHVGVVEDVRIDKTDRRGRAVLRFGSSARSSEVFQDIVDGIRRHISVGYRVHEMVLEKLADEDEEYRIVDWEPFEISFVSVPADTSVGVGRSQPQAPVKPVKREDSPMTEDEKRALEEQARADERKKAQEQHKDDIAQVRKDAGKAEKERIREINVIAKEFGVRELADEFIEKGETVEQMRQATLAAIAKRGGHQPGKIKPIGMDQRDVEQYRFSRAMAAIAFPTDKRVQDLAGYEIEVSRAAADASGMDVQGIMIPPDVYRASMKRDLNVGTAADGGNLVADNLQSQSFIDLLRNRLVVAQLGATTLGDLDGNITVPGQSAAATGYWIAEGAAPTESQQAIRQVPLTPKTYGAFTDYTRQLLLQSSIDVENFIRNDLVSVLALGIDLASMYGSGAAGQPLGVANQVGIGSVTFGAANPTYAEVVALESAIAAANADVDSMGYAMRPNMRGSLKTTPKFSGTGMPVWEPGNQVNGYASGVSNQVVDGDLLFGNWSDLLIGMWGGLDIMVDPFSLSTSGGTRIVALQSIDNAVRNAVSFALGNDGV